ncbi:MAG: UDP-N-acetylglucosamine 1-carboxyvinyltransferase [Candidatus Sericytochromatia bacterium]|nr:MAG: UDP-N-acetylglucosamine 1-carboxyvinyltransferase [Candidatus Sericytochromatia bacterium]
MTEKLIIKGGNPLKGEVNISGAKNSALVVLAASILSKDDVVIKNVPDLTDVNTIIELLNYFGSKIERKSKGEFVINSRFINKNTAPYELVSKMRASFFTLGALLARFGEAQIPLPGGCAIGSRPVDIHLKGLKALGAEVSIEHGMTIVKANKLIGNKIYLDFPSVGATENIIMAACLAEGTTIIENCAKEPEVVDLANFLNSMGAKIHGAGSATITIDGVKKLHSTEHNVIPDRIEAGTFMLAAGATKGKIVVHNALEKHLESLISKMIEAGVKINIIDDKTIEVDATNTIIKPVDVRTLPYPGFFTDLQSQMVAFLSLAKGTSIVYETVFENRFMYVDELNRMGADIKTESNLAIIKGVPSLSGAPVKATDLRAAAALAIAGFSAEGETTITELQYLDRGYENFEEKCKKLGADIKRIKELPVLTY